MSGNWTAPCEAGWLAVPFTIIDAPYCDAGYYCPDIIVNQTNTYPQICPPTVECQLHRLGSKFCDAQGLYEPTLCLPGHYCANFTSMLPCPEGTYCLRGSSTPTACPIMSYCPPQSEFKREYGGLLMTILLDVVLIILYFIVRRWCERRASTRRQRNGRYLALNQSITIDTAEADPSSNDSKHLVVASGLQTSSAKDVLEDGFRSCNAAFRLDITFKNLGYTLPRPISKTILSGVSGHIRPGRVTAVMGPSGAGKTTFMSVLMGKVTRTDGNLFINGEEDEMYKYKKAIGYVPQEDIMMHQLTVRENITFSARMRLPRHGWTEKKIAHYVDAVIDVLGLRDCADTLIGDVSSRGVSGGQRKRTNIGIELAVAPAAIFLDEPTSGLDSSAALEVCRTLRAIADLGLTVVAVIHQPRLEIFNTFDDLLLLAPGGITAYMGPREGVVPYFDKLGFNFRAGNNPADELLDFVAGVGDLRARRDVDVATISTGNAPLVGSTTMPLLISFKEKHTASQLHYLSETARFFADRWEQHETAYRSDGITHCHSHRGTSDEPPAASIWSDRGAAFWQQVLLCHNRSVLQQYRQATTYALEMGVASLAGGMMGAAAMGLDGLYQGILKPPYTLVSPAPMEMLLPSIGFYVCLAVGLAGSPAGVLAFGEEKLVYYREAAAGHNTLAYYIGKTISVIYRFVLGSMHFTGIFMLLAKPTSSFGQLYAIVWTQFFCVYGLAAIMSMLVKRENSALLAVIVSMIVGCLCGYGPSVKDWDAWYLPFVPGASYARWGVEAWFDCETRPYRSHFMVEEISAPGFGYTLNRFGTDLAITVAMGIAYRIIAYILLVSVNKANQR